MHHNMVFKVPQAAKPPCYSENGIFPRLLPTITKHLLCSQALVQATTMQHVFQHDFNPHPDFVIARKSIVSRRDK